MSTTTALHLTDQELVDITGYSRGAEQLRELHRRGYWRACRLVTGEVFLSRSHFEAVERGEDQQRGSQQRPAPRLRVA